MGNGCGDWLGICIISVGSKIFSKICVSENLAYEQHILVTL